MEKKPLILIVDDERGTRLLVKKALNQKGFDTAEAGDGVEAVEVFDARRPDLVLLDVIMPGMDGFEACRRIRAAPAGVTVPIVIVTGSDDLDAIQKAYEAGATDFFSKPINMIVLGERVRYMLRASATAVKLSQSRELLARAQSVAGMGSFSYEPGSSELSVSKEFSRIIGFHDSDRDISWDSFWNKIHPEDQETLLPLFQQAYTAGVPFRRDIRLAGKGLDNRFAMLQIDPETDLDGKIVRLIGILQDITERKLSELLEKDQNYVMQRIVRKEPLNEILLESGGLLERQRPGCMAAISRVEEDKIQSMISPSLPEEFCRLMEETAVSSINGTSAAGAYLGQHAVAEDISASALWKNLRKEALSHGLNSSASVPIFSGTGQVLGTVDMFSRDIYHTSNADLELMERIANLVALAVEQEHLSRKLTYQAQHDTLTGLLNRGALINWMSQTLKQFERSHSLGAYLLIDLDRFKRVNDFLGHHVGDLLLKEIAERLKRCVRESDVLCRVGGDEFVLVMPDLRDKNDSIRAAARILENFSSPFFIEGNKMQVEASIGITLFPQDASDATSLHKNADIAMYVAKNEGGNRFHFFDSKMHEAVVQRLQIENDLRKALERGEFEIYYQPQLDLTSNRVMVMEALIRWNHPERGRIPPDRFIQTAEESRLIIPIGKWVLREACRQNVEWQKQGFEPVRVAVNVSAVQFTETDFAGTVQEILEESGLDPYWLEIEITETVVLRNLEKVCWNMERLKKLGVTTTLDDFGTGYSSITYLSKMPLDGIKIDQSFIRDVKVSAFESRNANFVKAFASLARNFHLQLVAEGIETEEQSRLLKKLGYAIGQGFLFSAPLPAGEAELFLAGGLSRAEASNLHQL